LSDEADTNPIVCFCHRVRLDEIVKAIRGGSTTLEKVQADTAASTGCGGCEYDVIEILEKELAKAG
jgi:nitrite reductase (NADH) large subunit